VVNGRGTKTVNPSLSYATMYPLLPSSQSGGMTIKQSRHSLYRGMKRISHSEAEKETSESSTAVTCTGSQERRGLLPYGPAHDAPDADGKPNSRHQHQGLIVCIAQHAQGLQKDIRPMPILGGQLARTRAGRCERNIFQCYIKPSLQRRSRR
jgi:hypothetical protein